MRYQQYKFKFYMDARHAIYIGGKLGEVHPHTWEIVLHVVKGKENFEPFHVLEKAVEEFLEPFQNNYLNDIKPFDILNPTIENVCLYFKEKLQEILNAMGWIFLMIEMSETPGRTYVISMLDEQEMEQNLKARDSFVANITHELRTPVSIIKGACEYGLKCDETPEERQETLEMIARQAEKMAQLIGQLLSMTRLDQGTERARLEPVDLGVLVEGLIRERGYEEDKLFLSVSPGVKVRGDGALLARLTENLVENALKYGKPGGHVWVTVKSQGEEGILEVRDDGIGIPKDQQEKIWQRFYQVDPSRSDESNGVGLGLSMVRQIAQLHGGTVTLDSVEGIGSAFALHLPLWKEEA